MRRPVLFWKSNRSASCYFCTELLQLDLAVKFMWEQTEWMENRRHGRCCMWMCWFWMSLIQSQFLKAALSSAPLSEFFNRLSEHMAWLRWLNFYANSLGWKITFRVGIAREILQMFLRGSKTKQGHSKHSHQSRPLPSACSQVTPLPLYVYVYIWPSQSLSAELSLLQRKYKISFRSWCCFLTWCNDKQQWVITG